MCLMIKQTSPKIAEEDITVYKVIVRDNLDSDLFYSTIQSFLYRINQLNEVDIAIGDDWCASDSFSEAVIRHILGPNYKSQAAKLGYISVDRGFHSFSTFERAKHHLQYDTFSFKIVIGRFTIPKGSEYYYSKEVLEYASNKIILNEIVYSRYNSSNNQLPKGG